MKLISFDKSVEANVQNRILVCVGYHTRPSTIKGLIARVLSKFSEIWKILKTQVQLGLNCTRPRVITCLSIKSKVIQRKSHA